MIKCPCDECICVPMCINKEWNILVRDCLLLSAYLGEHEMNTKAGHTTTVPIRALKQEYYVNKSATGMLTWSTKMSGIVLGIYQEDNTEW